jgi:hypothetical protein
MIAGSETEMKVTEGVEASFEEVDIIGHASATAVPIFQVRETLDSDDSDLSGKVM